MALDYRPHPLGGASDTDAVAGPARLGAGREHPKDLRINEFVAANATGITDNTGDRADWIELHNTSASTVDLAGWVIGDGANNHVLPAESIAAGGFVVVFASGDQSRTIAGEPHLPFRLPAAGESLTLTDPGGTLTAPAWKHPSTYPAQVSDVSYGVGTGAALHFFDHPTPGAANATGLGGIVDPVTFSVAAGFKTNSQAVVLDTPTPGATIRYTTDGSTPTTTNGTAITPGASITVSSTSVVRAVAYRSGWVTSPTETRSYIFTADVIAQDASPPPGWPADEAINGQDMNYGMDPDVVTGNEALIRSSLLAIPTVSIVTDLDNLFDPTSGLYVNASQRGRAWERPASIELIDPSGAELGDQRRAENQGRL